MRIHSSIPFKTKSRMAWERSAQYCSPTNHQLQLQQQLPAAPNKLPPPYQVKTPTFSGRVKDFAKFSDRFTEIMSIHSEHYSDADKCCILADAMTDREARKVMNDYASKGFDVAFQQLRNRYGRASTIYPQLVEELINRNRYDYSQESVLQALDCTQRVLSAMDKIGGKNIEALEVALVLREWPDISGQKTRSLFSRILSSLPPHCHTICLANPKPLTQEQLPSSLATLEPNQKKSLQQLQQQPHPGQLV